MLTQGGGTVQKALKCAYVIYEWSLTYQRTTQGMIKEKCLKMTFLAYVVSKVEDQELRPGQHFESRINYTIQQTICLGFLLLQIFHLFWSFFNFSSYFQNWKKVYKPFSLSLMWALKIAAVLRTGYRVSQFTKHPLLLKSKAECLT